MRWCGSSRREFPSSLLLLAPSFALVLQSVSQFGFPFHLPEEEIGRPGHLELTHLFLMYKFNGGVTELFADHLVELFPVGETISRSAIEGRVLVFVVVVVGGVGVIIKFFAEVYPPILCCSPE